VKRILLTLALATGLGSLPGFVTVASAANKIYVVHGIPNVPVNVWVNGGEVLTGFTFGTIAGPLDLAAGDYNVELKTTDNTAVIYAETLTVPAGDGWNISIAAHFNALGAPDLTPFINANTGIGDGHARLGVRHAAYAPAVDVVVSGDVPKGKGGVLLPGVVSTQGAVLDVPVDDYAIWLRVSRNGGKGNAKPVLKPVNLSAEEGTAYYIFAVGSVADGTFQYLIQVNP
jgi:Domain of unknown function (DUF4397)